GSLRGYKRLFVREFNPLVPVTMAMVTDILDPDTEMVAVAEGIKIFVVRPG
ncbi:unnamed protein product, partial [marine sediment metagenome]